MTALAREAHKCWRRLWVCGGSFKQRPSKHEGGGGVGGVGALPAQCPGQLLSLGQHAAWEELKEGGRRKPKCPCHTLENQRRQRQRQ